MDKEKIAVMAAKDSLPSEKLSLAEWLLFYRLRDLYRDFRTGKVTKSGGEKRKGEITRQFEIDCQNELFVERCAAKNGELYKSIESAATAYRENKTLENADKFVEAVYGVKMKEE